MKPLYLLCLPVLLSACTTPSVDSPAPQLPDFPDIITAERGGFSPEGIEYDRRNQRFLLGSIVEGRVYSLDAAGRLNLLVNDAELSAVVGIEVDEARNRLIVANADSRAFSDQTSGFAQVGVYALDTGERIALVDLDSSYGNAPDDTRFFPNDVAVDTAGNIYITDSLAVVVYKVDTAFQSSVFLQRSQFPENQSLNGIVTHPDSYLIVAGSGTGVLYKADLTNPSYLMTVGSSELIPGADGMVWSAPDTLAIAARGQTVALVSDDNWYSARVVKRATQGAASTVARVGDDLYLVYPHFADQAPPTVEKVEFIIEPKI